jgi:hypothetical protein
MHRMILMLLLLSGPMLCAAEEKSAEPMDWEARAILGWHQAGASSSESSQNLFFDFFIDRPLIKRPAGGSDFGLWGQVRVASSPQQKTIPLSQFAVDFAKELGSIPVNQLAQSAEFLTGVEYRPRWFKWTGARVRTLGLIGFFGASGAFSDPSTQGRVFRVPSVDSPQWPNFVSVFPKFEDPAYRAQAQFIGLMPPDRERFFRQYGGGIRYTSYDPNKKQQAPSMFTASIGQDQAISGGRYVGAVMKFDAFYPLPFSTSEHDFGFIYLFGTANLAVAKPKANTPLALELVSTECASTAAAADTGTRCGVKLYQDNVAVFTIPTSRDTYRIGVGIDFISFLNSAKKGFAK